MLKWVSKERESMRKMLQKRRVVSFTEDKDYTNSARAPPTAK